MKKKKKEEGKNIIWPNSLYEVGKFLPPKYELNKCLIYFQI